MTIVIIVVCLLFFLGVWLGTLQNLYKKYKRKKVSPQFVNVDDRLIAMWNQQASFVKLLQEKRDFPNLPVDLSSKDGQKLLKNITHHIQDELHEASQHLKNSKSHRATLIPEFNRVAYIEELVDALHLYFELAQAAGVTLDELYDAYIDKGEINFERINSGY